MVMGPTAALYEAMRSFARPATRAEIERAAGLEKPAADGALRVLARALEPSCGSWITRAAAVCISSHRARRAHQGAGNILAGRIEARRMNGRSRPLAIRNARRVLEQRGPSRL